MATAKPQQRPQVMLRTPEPKRMGGGGGGFKLAPPNTGTKTPFGGGKNRVSLEQMLEVLDMEIETRTKEFRAALSTALAGIRSAQGVELHALPPALKAVKMKDLAKHWDGSLPATFQKMKLSETRRVHEEKVIEVNELEVAVKGGKRKRAGAEQVESPEKSSRGNKNARKTPAVTPLSKSAAAVAAKKKVKQPLFSNPNKQPSNLPQDHIFAPDLSAATPFRKLKQGDILYTANGSPILNPYTASAGMGTLNVDNAGKNHASGSAPRSPLRNTTSRHDGDIEEEDEDEDEDEEGDDTVRQENEEEDEDDDGDLPDVDELERRLEARATGRGGGAASSSTSSRPLSQAGSGSSKSNGVYPSLPKAAPKYRRPSSLLIRRSVLPSSGTGNPADQGDGANEDDEDDEVDNVPHKRSITIRGHQIVFNPFDLDRAHLNAELSSAENDFTDEERRLAMEQVQKVVVQAMEERFKMWQV